MSAIIEKVEIFIQRVHDLDYIITPDAKKTWYPTVAYPSAIHPSYKHRTTLSDYLANAISEYQENKDDEKRRLTLARICLIWIDRAFACGVIKEGQGLARKLKECQEKNAQLEQDIEKISDELLKLKREQEAFNKYIQPTDENRLGDEDEPLP